MNIQTPQFDHLTHASPKSFATELAHLVEFLQDRIGLTVQWARSRVLTVPNCYRYAWKVDSSQWVYSDGEISEELTTLETRSFSADIPARFRVEGEILPDEIPAGFRCTKRSEEFTELVASE